MKFYLSQKTRAKTYGSKEKKLVFDIDTKVTTDTVKFVCQLLASFSLILEVKRACSLGAKATWRLALNINKNGIKG